MRGFARRPLRYYGKFGSSNDGVMAKECARQTQVLALAWRMDAGKMCYFSRRQFRTLANYDVKSINDLRAKLPQFLESALRNFRSFYMFAFGFGLDREKGERVLPLELAMGMWQLVFSTPERPSKHLPVFFEFLQQSDTRGITRDTWDLYLTFTDTVDEACSNYSDEEAWPSLLDEFVEYVQEKHG
eukprot:TRINITY_DN5208_c0_g1_i2.p1 TRINITY_DN5208_c0_g1~~TRINITY_DN5208_c0_g1_i2.p1  ORF type:complete len:186 (+),score=31.17 TRINITY_DN5208_c0_g1_i2:152-709(+)